MTDLIHQYLNVTQEQLDKLFGLCGKDLSISITGSWNGLTEITLWYRPETEPAMKKVVKNILKESV